MANYKEIVTKAVISKGKKLFVTNNTVGVDNPSTILGCWVINHDFNGTKSKNQVIINGSYDVNIWYSYDNDTKTDVLKERKTYQEVINMRDRNNVDGEEVIVRSLRQPTCSKVEIDGNSINYTVEKELGIELVGDVKVKVEANDEEDDDWDDIVEEVKREDLDKIDNVEEDFINDPIQEEAL